MRYKYEKNCDWCGAEFLTNRDLQRFCSPECKSEFHNNESLIIYNKRKEEMPIVEKVNTQLLKNRKILLPHVGTTIEVKVLEREGFTCKHITEYIHSPDGEKIAFVCYDVAYYYPRSQDTHIKIELLNTILDKIKTV
jgi:hypothetical protein